MVQVGCWFSQRPRRDPDLPLALGEPVLTLAYHKNRVFLLGFWLISQAHFCFIGNNIWTSRIRVDHTLIMMIEPFQIHWMHILELTFIYIVYINQWSYPLCGEQVAYGYLVLYCKKCLCSGCKCLLYCVFDHHSSDATRP